MEDEEEDDRVEVIAVEDGTTSGDQGQHDSEQGLKIAEKYSSEAKKELEKLGSKRPSQQEINKLVSETMRFVMFKTHQSESAPIKYDANLPCRPRCATQIHMLSWDAASKSRAGISSNAAARRFCALDKRVNSPYPHRFRIRHEDLVKVVQNNGYQVRGLPGAIISLAQERFARTFDLDLREVKRLAKKRQTGKSLEPTTSISGTYYILVSLLSDDMRRRFMKREDVRMERAFTMVVLSLIYVRVERDIEYTRSPTLASHDDFSSCAR